MLNGLPHELGDPDRMARSLSDSLDLAVKRLTENQSRDLATVLGEHLADPKAGTLAAILPLSAATAPSGLRVRRELAEKFWIEKIVTSHDPLRIAFSENTNISEMMVVCRRWNAGSGVETKPPTKFFNLAVNSDRPTDAISLAERISKDDLDGTGVVKFNWPAERIAEGDWGPVRFYSPYLVATFEALRSGALFRSGRSRQVGESHVCLAEFHFWHPGMAWVL